MKFLVLEEVDSTNSYVAAHAEELADKTMVMAATQSAGRGQRGNSWESEPGKNLTFTFLWRPEGFQPRHQFAISEAAALAITDYLKSEGIEAKVKWPNDIYVDDRKISGILIEHSITPSEIEHSRIGIGLNVNQTLFVSDAPNPVSAANIDGKTRDISRVAAQVGTCLEKRLDQISTAEGREAIHSEFIECLWRGDGKPHPFRKAYTGDEFMGIIKDVDPSGPIVIAENESGEVTSYFFKQIEFIL